MAKKFAPIYLNDVSLLAAVEGGYSSGLGSELGGGFGIANVELANQQQVTENKGRLSLPNLSDIQVGRGTQLFGVDDDGLWLGAAVWASAPFRVSMAGALTATSVTITGMVTTFRQAAIPTSLSAGDIWYDSDDADKMYRAAAAGATTIGVGAWERVDPAWANVQDPASTKPNNNATVGATAGTDLKDSGATVLNDREIKNIASFTAGETISGATLPVPVYVDSSTGKVYACDANDNTKVKFTGFAISTAAADASIKVQFEGLVGGFTGLTKDTDYYVQDAVGTIGTTKGTYAIYVGRAMSTTEIYIQYNYQFLLGVAASDTLQQSADTERTYTDAGAPYLLSKEIQIRLQGAYRVKFDAKSEVNNTSARIYKNGVAFGTDRLTVAAAGYSTFSEDLSFDEQDLIQLYYSTGAVGTAYLRNFRLYFTKTILADTTVNTD